MYKFNGGKGAVICNRCRVIIRENCGPTKPLGEGDSVDFCEDCKKAMLACEKSDRPVL